MMEHQMIASQYFDPPVYLFSDKINYIYSEEKVKQYHQ